MIKKLDYIDRVDYDKLPQSFKDNRKKLTELGKQLRKLEKDKIKYQSKLTSIKTDLKDLTKQYNKLYNELKPININYSPKTPEEDINVDKVSSILKEHFNILDENYLLLVIFLLIPILSFLSFFSVIPLPSDKPKTFNGTFFFTFITIACNTFLYSYLYCKIPK